MDCVHSKFESLLLRLKVCFADLKAGVSLEALRINMYWLLVAFVISVFMVVTTPDRSDDHSTDEQDYDHPNLHEMNMAGDQTKKKTREQNKDHAEYHPSQGQRFVIKFKNDEIVHDSVAKKLNKKCAMIANDFKLLPMDVPWFEQDQKNIDEAMETIQFY
ncbi:hypothetical protein ZOSMA_1G02190 [Zostera marina]|uniref:Uncharacterized protein n=1 Tax=Zostera marina TaxID=29655 RepID=A0A0K9PME2_ZOSMR|nr:hypothetical protein ZOSMA_1G02190 [Zostera marina]